MYPLDRTYWSGLAECLWCFSEVRWGPCRRGKTCTCFRRYTWFRRDRASEPDCSSLASLSKSLSSWDRSFPVDRQEAWTWKITVVYLLFFRSSMILDEWVKRGQKGLASRGAFCHLGKEVVFVGMKQGSNLEPSASEEDALIKSVRPTCPALLIARTL